MHEKIQKTRVKTVLELLIECSDQKRHSTTVPRLKKTLSHKWFCRVILIMSLICMKFEKSAIEYAYISNVNRKIVVQCSFYDVRLSATKAIVRMSFINVANWVTTMHNLIQPCRQSSVLIVVNIKAINLKSLPASSYVQIVLRRFLHSEIVISENEVV